MTTNDRPAIEREREIDPVKLEAWRLNVALECSHPNFGGGEAHVAIGGAVLDLRDLLDILECAALRDGGE